MSTYYAGQLGIALSVLDLKEVKTNSKNKNVNDSKEDILQVSNKNKTLTVF